MPKVATQMPLSVVALDRRAETPLFRQIYDSLRTAILQQRLAPGFKLPSSRELAVELKVSRNTVTAAFDQLAAEGYLVSRTGAGTFVSDAVPDEFQQPPKSARPPSAAPDETDRELSRRGKIISRTAAIFEYGSRVVRPFNPCLPNIQEFPYRIWARLAARRLNRPNRSLQGYGDPAGYEPLRREIAVYLGAARAVRCEPRQIIIVSGAQQALDLALRLLTDPGDAVWIEEPGNFGTRAAVTAAGARIVPVPVDEEGLDVEAGAALDARARLVCVTPSHQYPLGVTMALKRRIELLKWANRTGSWILEDDYDSEYRYGSRPVASLQGLDARGGRVIYIGTFSKVLSPALRLGYLVVPPPLIDSFTTAKAILDRHSPIFEQMILADFFAEGHFARHIRRMRELYAERRELLKAAVRAAFGETVEIMPSEAGLHLTILLGDKSDDLAIARRAAELGINLEPLSALYTEEKNKKNGLVLGFASFSETEIREGAEKLAAVCREIQSSGVSARP
ncbi:MAG: PLP-dependent aminotransferase family protein [Acidobacteria bacterium]|nr:PLP-dependent aminotransferase family protein [Acidobacteriota bacterium]